MAKVTVLGLINIETNVRVDGFPINYIPVLYPFNGIGTTVSGVGYNVAKALTVLDNKINLCTLVGKDILGYVVRKELENLKIPVENVLHNLKETPQSVILYDTQGKRQINVDLKDIQETEYPSNIVEELIRESDLVILCNINFSRKYLKTAKDMGKLIATDVHTISDINDEYNKDYLEYADILFLSNENIMGREEEFIRTIASKYSTKIIVIGLGDKGAMLYQSCNNSVITVPSVKVRPVINTIGAGDALFSCFIHYYLKGFTPEDSLFRAVYFASYKIGESGAASGFLTEKQLDFFIKPNCSRI